jgi:hypothetical protein
MPSSARGRTASARQEDRAEKDEKATATKVSVHPGEDDGRPGHERQRAENHGAAKPRHRVGRDGGDGRADQPAHRNRSTSWLTASRRVTGGTTERTICAVPAGTDRSDQ